MPEFLSSAVIIQEEAPKMRSFPVLPSAVLAIEAITERGPIATPTLVTSWDEFEQTFGGFLASYESAVQLKMYFSNGGRYAYVSRTCHFTNIANKASAVATAGSVTLQTAGGADTAASITGTSTAPWALEPNDTLVASVGGEANQTATFQATAATITSGNAAPFVLTNGMTFEADIDDGETQTATFATADFVDIGAATAAEVAAVLNAQLYGVSVTTTVGGAVVVTSDKKGLASSVHVLNSGTSFAALAFSGTAATGTGNVDDIRAVTFEEVKAILEAAFTNDTGVVCTSSNGQLVTTTVNTGSDASIEYKSTSTAELAFGITTEEEHVGSDSTPQDTLTLTGISAFDTADYRAAITTASNSLAPTEEFDLAIMRASTGETVEYFPSLTMDLAADRYAIDVINATTGSRLFNATDEEATGSTAVRRPANVSAASFSGSNTGLTSLADADFIGNKSALTGLYAFDSTPDVTLLICPDRVTTAVQKAMLTYARVDFQGLLFVVLDPLAGRTAATIVDQKTALGAEGNTELGAIYWPRIVIANPSTAVYGTSDTKTVCPSGAICGMMARNDANQQEGPFYQPAGVEGGVLYDVIGVEMPEVLLKAKRDLVFPKRVNPINYWRRDNYYYVDGARTLKGDGNFPSVGARRGVSYLEKVLSEGLEYVRHKNNTEQLRRDINKDVRTELLGWTNRGAFQSNDPDQAFYVDTSDALNTAAVIKAKQIKVRVGLATNEPGEFIWLIVTKDTRKEDAELATQLAR
jgi:hypothetical protein